MIYINYILGALIMVILLGYFLWIFKDLKQMIYGHKKRNEKKRKGKKR